MMGPKITVSESGDATFVREAIGTLQNAKVYVGIPEAETLRKNVPKGKKQAEVTNAGLLYIHTNGSELRHIPARPVIEPSIEANHDPIETGLHCVIDLILDGKKDEAKALLKTIGTQGANFAKRWFTDPRNGWKQNAPSTIKAKLSRLRGKAYKEAIDVFKSVDEHMPLYGTTDLDSVNTPLIDFGEMRRAITHVEGEF